MCNLWSESINIGHKFRPGILFLCTHIKVYALYRHIHSHLQCETLVYTAG